MEFLKKFVKTVKLRNGKNDANESIQSQQNTEEPTNLKEKESHQQCFEKEPEKTADPGNEIAEQNKSKNNGNQLTKNDTTEPKKDVFDIIEPSTSMESLETQNNVQNEAKDTFEEKGEQSKIITETDESIKSAEDGKEPNKQETGELYTLEEDTWKQIEPDCKELSVSEKDVSINTESGSDEFVQLFCEPCRNDDVYAQASGFCQTCQEYLCRDCFDYHCRPKPMRHHKLLDGDSMPKQNAEIRTGNGNTGMCSKHDMVLTIFCCAHNVLGCIKCLSHEHTECSDVSFIRDCAKEFSNSEEFRSFCEELKTLENDIGAEQKHIDACSKSSEEYAVSINLSEAIDESIRLTEKLKEIKARLQTAITETDVMQILSSKCKETMMELKTIFPDTESDELSFISTKKSKPKLKLYREQLEAVKLQTKSLYHDSDFEHDTETCRSNLHNIQRFLGRPNIAQISVCVSNNDTDIRSNHATDGKDSRIDTEECRSKLHKIQSPLVGPKIVQSIECISKFTSDAKSDDATEDKNCRITGSCALLDGRIIFVDYNNKMVKCYSPRVEKMVPYTIPDDERPFDATEVHNGMIAVTLPSAKAIQVLLVHREELSFYKHIDTTHNCHGIASNDVNLIIASDSPPKVEIIDMDGYSIRIFANDCFGQQLFTSPWYVAFDSASSRIFVADRKKHAVIALTREGEIAASYKAYNLERPYGIAVDASGIVFVCGRWSNNIHCLTTDCELINIYEDDDVDKPESIVAWNKRERLYIGNFDDDQLSVSDYEVIYKQEQK